MHVEVVAVEEAEVEEVNITQDGRATIKGEEVEVVTFITHLQYQKGSNRFMVSVFIMQEMAIADSLILAGSNCCHY